jgi:hypothetical protein
MIEATAVTVLEARRPLAPPRTVRDATNPVEAASRRPAPVGNQRRPSAALIDISWMRHRTEPDYRDFSNSLSNFGAQSLWFDQRPRTIRIEQQAHSPASKMSIT